MSRQHQDGSEYTSTNEETEEQRSGKTRAWTTEEDARLVEMVTRSGPGNWTLVAEGVGSGRNGKSCRLRWHNQLDPGLKKGGFSEEETRIIIEKHAEYGNHWAQIATHLAGRTDNAIKNYWNGSLKKQVEQANTVRAALGERAPSVAVTGRRRATPAAALDRIDDGTAAQPPPPLAPPPPPPPSLQPTPWPGAAAPPAVLPGPPFDGGSGPLASLYAFQTMRAASQAAAEQPPAAMLASLSATAAALRASRSPGAAELPGSSAPDGGGGEARPSLEDAMASAAAIASLNPGVLHDLANLAALLQAVSALSGHAQRTAYTVIAGAAALGDAAQPLAAYVARQMGAAGIVPLPPPPLAAAVAAAAAAAAPGLLSSAAADAATAAYEAKGEETSHGSPVSCRSAAAAPHGSDGEAAGPPPPSRGGGGGGGGRSRRTALGGRRASPRTPTRTWRGGRSDDGQTGVPLFPERPPPPGLPPLAPHAGDSGGGCLPPSMPDLSMALGSYGATASCISLLMNAGTPALPAPPATAAAAAVGPSAADSADADTDDDEAVAVALEALAQLRSGADSPSADAGDGAPPPWAAAAAAAPLPPPARAPKRQRPGADDDSDDWQPRGRKASRRRADRGGGD